MSRAVFGNMGDEFSDNIELMKAGEYQSFAVFEVNEFLNNIHHAFLLENIFPKICGWISVGIGWIALTAVGTCAV